MPIFTYIKEKKWITYTLLSIFSITIIISHATGLIYQLAEPQKQINHIAIINNKKITPEQYQQSYKQEKVKLQQQGYPKRQINQLAHITLWENLLEKYLYTTTYNQLNLKVTKQETFTTLQEARDQPHLHMIPELKDEQGNFSKKKWITTLAKLTQQPNGKQIIKHIEEEIKQQRLKQKLNYLTQSTTHTTKLEANQQLSLNSKKINIQYLYIPYTSIPQKQYITHKQKKQYLKKNFKKYQVQETRTLQYIILPIEPSEEDKKAFLQHLQQLAKKFEQTKDPVKFAQKHTETPENTTTHYTKNPLTPEASQTYPQDQVIGPIQIDENQYTLYKLIKNKNYTLITIQKKCKPSQYTQTQYLKKTQNLQKTNNPIQWEKKAKKHGLQIHTLTLSKNNLQNALSQKDPISKIIKWLFNPNTQKNTTSQPIEIPERYILCIMKEKTPAGIPPMEKINNTIEKQIKKQQAAKKIIQKLQPHIKPNKTLQQIAKAYGKHARVSKLQQLDLQQTNLPHAGKALKAIGQALSLKTNQKTKIIQDENGILIIERTPDTHQTTINTSIKKYQNKINQQKKQETLKKLRKLHLKKTKIQDNRHVFF